jgi:hypothetical protein
MVRDACMMQSFDFWVSPTLHQAMACTDRLNGWDLVRLKTSPIWKILCGIREDHQKVRYEDLPYTYLRQDLEI